MNKLILKKCKSIILILLIVPMLMLSFNSQRASANPAFGAAIVVGGVTIEASVVAELVGATLIIGSSTIVASNWNSDCSRYVAQQMLDAGNATQYFSVQVNSAGQSIFRWTKEGFDTCVKGANDFFSTHPTGDATVKYNDVNTISATAPIYADDLPTISRVHIGVCTFHAEYSNVTGDLSVIFMKDSYSNSFAVKVWQGDYSLASICYVGSGQSVDIPISIPSPTGSVCIPYSDSTGACGDSIGVPLTGAGAGSISQPMPQTGTDAVSYPFPDGTTWDNIKDRYYYPPGSDTSTGDTIDGVDGIIDYIMDNTEVTPNAENVDEAINDMIKKGTETTNGKGIARNIELSGGFEETLKDFNSLKPSNIKDIRTKYGEGKVGKLSDGTTVVARPGSETGGPTLQIKVSNSKIYKFRY